MTEPERAATRELRDAIENVRFALLGMTQIPESASLERYFGDGADEQIRLYQAALRRWRKTYGR